MIFGFLQNIGWGQLLVCIVLVFILFGGARKIPELAKSLGKAKSEFKKGLAEGEREVAEAEEEEKKKKSAEPAKELV